MQLSDLTQKGNILFVNAHPDDESMAHGAAISLLTESHAASVYVVTASCGEASTKGDVTKRLDELERAYDTLGVLGQKQGHRFYPELPDSELHKPENIQTIVRLLAKKIKQHKITTLVTPGWDGFDGHSDHIAVHIASALAAHQIREETGQQVNVLGLNARGEGAVHVPVDYDKKYHALSQHASQFLGRLENIIKSNAVYQELMKEETYDRLDPLDDYRRAQQFLESPLSRHIPK